MAMDWADLLFLHWCVDAAHLQAHLPEGVHIDTFDGAAWLGVVPFCMQGTRARWLPPLPTAGTFPELNLRTYVRVHDRPGVWFFSLDAASRLAVFGARSTFGLPYFNARMSIAREGDALRYASERSDRRGPAAVFRGSWTPQGAHGPALPGTLEHFLCERYCLFVARRGGIACGEIHHAPWQLARAEVHLQHCDMTRLLGIDLAGPPESALTARTVRAIAFAPERCGATAISRGWTAGSERS